MNIFHCEVLNTLHARGRDEWTPALVLKHIQDLRTDFTDEVNLRRVQGALLALFKDGKVTRRKDYSKGNFVPYQYTAAQPDLIRPNYDDAWRTFKVSVKLWPYVLIFSVVMLLGVGLIDTLNFIVF